MTEEEAQAWIAAQFGVSRETKLRQFVDLFRNAAVSQNLIAPSTVNEIWSRHIVDSAQLMQWVPDEGSWLDIGSGAGLPGIVTGILRDAPVELVEPRKLRTAFSGTIIVRGSLGLAHVKVVTKKIERTAGEANVISARAVTALDQLFTIAAHRADQNTFWILPKGRNAHSEVEAARRPWQGSFYVEPNITAPDSLIVIAREVRRR